MNHHTITTRTYTIVWAALLGLTLLTVAVAYADLQKFTIFTALFVATGKVLLVLLYFMHIRYEKGIFPMMISIVVLTYGVFMALLFVEIASR